jgi:hypothetical protein
MLCTSCLCCCNSLCEVKHAVSVQPAAALAHSRACKHQAASDPQWTALTLGMRGSANAAPYRQQHGHTCSHKPNNRSSSWVHCRRAAMARTAGCTCLRFTMETCSTLREPLQTVNALPASVARLRRPPCPARGPAGRPAAPGPAAAPRRGSRKQKQPACAAPACA